MQKNQEGEFGAFVYGPAGERIRGTVDGVTTHYVGPHYEKVITGIEANTVRKYYYAGSQRIATRQAMEGYFFLLGDHLGSTAVIASSGNGSKVGEVRYEAFGETRYNWGSAPTSYRYTGQREEARIGLYYYEARWYDSYIARWIQPDTIVPTPSYPQSLNRYSYVLNSPCNYADPSGHCGEKQDHPDQCWDTYDKIIGTLGSGFEFLAGWDTSALLNLLDWLDLGIRFDGIWTSEKLASVIDVLDFYGEAIGRARFAYLAATAAQKMSGGRVQQLIFLNMNARAGDPAEDITGWYAQAGTIGIYDEMYDDFFLRNYRSWWGEDAAVIRSRLLGHEVGHVLMDGIRARYPHDDYNYYENLYDEQVPRKDQPYTANPFESLATEIGDIALGRSVSAPMMSFWYATLSPVVFGHSTGGQKR